MGVEPGEARAVGPVGRCRRPAIAPAWDVQSPPRTSRRASGPALVSAGRDVPGEPRQVLADPRPVLRPRIGVRRPARVVRRRPRGPEDRVRTIPARAASRSSRPGLAERREARAPCPPKWPPRAVGDPTDDDGGRGTHGSDHTCRIPAWPAERPPGSGMMRPCASPTSPSSATSPAGSSPSSTCCARRTSQGWPMADAARARRRRDPRAVGRPDASATPSRPATRCCGARSRRCTRRSSRTRSSSFAGAEEAIFCLAQRPARAGRPRDRDLARLPEPVRGRARDRRRRDPPRAARGRRLGARRRSAARARSRPATRLIVVNAPHNPTGMLPDRATFDALVAIAARGRRAPARRRGLPRSSSSTPPTDCRPAPTRSSAGVSLGVMSKSFAMAGLRIGWLATRDRDLLARCAGLQGLHDDLLVGAVRGPGAHRAPGRGRRAGPQSRSIVTANLRRPRRVLRAPGRTASRGSGRGRARSGSRACTVPGVAIDDWAAGLVEAEGVLLAARVDLRVSAATTSGSGSAGRTCPRRWNASRRTRRRPCADADPQPAAAARGCAIGSPSRPRIARRIGSARVVARRAARAAAAARTDAGVVRPCQPSALTGRRRITSGYVRANCSGRQPESGDPLTVLLDEPRREPERCRG